MTFHLADSNLYAEHAFLHGRNHTFRFIVEDRDLKPKTAEVKPRDNWIPVEPRNRSPAARKSPLGGSEIWSKWLPKGALEASGRALDGLWEAFGRQGRF